MLETLPRSLLLILPLFVLVAATEGWYLQKRRGLHYDWRAFFASLGDAVGRRIIVGVVGVGAIAAVFSLAWDYRVATVPMDRWWSWVCSSSARNSATTGCIVRIIASAGCGQPTPSIIP